MKQLRLPIFNSKIKMYNLRIVPPDSISSEVTEFKKQFELLYGKQPLSRSKPHITIASFKMNSKHESFLLEVLNQLSQNKSFKLEIDRFAVLEGSKTLYLSIGNSKALKTIHKEVKSLYDKHLKRRLKSFSISDNPYMTISKATEKKMLYESLQHFQKNDYSKEMNVGDLTLVSRLKYKTWDWEHQFKLSEEEEYLLFDSSMG
ncbi:2'-5' RNA ligase family protein [Maribacter sp. HTCC2170]|uniref:2'-5' RNA ligase family protein n=1 Tax=Maribacter sp. (strain HTCC2170 / KCCM 42371) TaxID=313603 RepID=UPI0002F38C46|nr:2'-5' RNA ligase family protein [Maribacter sp. HTCC2170]